MIRNFYRSIDKNFSSAFYRLNDKNFSSASIIFPKSRQPKFPIMAFKNNLGCRDFGKIIEAEENFLSLTRLVRRESFIV